MSVDLTALANRAWHLNSEAVAISGQADGTALSTLTDAVNGVVATGSNSGGYWKKATRSGVPCLDCQAQSCYYPFGNGTPFNATMTGSATGYSWVGIVRRTANQFGTLLAKGSSVARSRFVFTLDQSGVLIPTGVRRADHSVGGPLSPGGGTLPIDGNFHLLEYFCVPVAAPTANACTMQEQFWIDGTLVYQNTFLQPAWDGTGPFTIGADSYGANALGFAATSLYQLVVLSSVPTAAERAAYVTAFNSTFSTSLPVPAGGTLTAGQTCVTGYSAPGASTYDGRTPQLFLTLPRGGSGTYNTPTVYRGASPSIGAMTALSPQPTLTLGTYGWTGADTQRTAGQDFYYAAVFTDSASNSATSTAAEKFRATGPNDASVMAIGDSQTNVSAQGLQPYNTRANAIAYTLARMRGGVVGRVLDWTPNNTSFAGFRSAAWITSANKIQEIADYCIQWGIRDIHDMIGTNDAGFDGLGAASAGTVTANIQDTANYLSGRGLRLIVQSPPSFLPGSTQAASYQANLDAIIPGIAAAIDGVKALRGDAATYAESKVNGTYISSDGAHMSTVGHLLGAVLEAQATHALDAAAPTYTAASNVRSGTDRGDGTLGTLVVPSASSVLSTATFDNGTQGTYVVAPASVVQSGYTYGVGGTGTTGTYSGGGGATLSEVRTELDARGLTSAFTAAAGSVPGGTVVAGSTTSSVVVSGLPAGCDYKGQHLYHQGTGESREIVSVSYSSPNYTFALNPSRTDPNDATTGPFSAGKVSANERVLPIP